jgi:WD40 repeat protein
MPRKELPLAAGDGPLPRFAADLRRLRQRVGGPSYRELSARAHYSIATLSSAAAGHRLPTLEVTLAYVRACGADAEEWRRRWHGVAAELACPDGAREEPPDGDTAASGEHDRAPYAGLAAYRSGDSQWFFGRERVIDDLVGRLADRRFIAVFGASGAGKTSLLRAGLVPRLESGHRRVIVFTPGPRPMEEIAVRLARPAGTTPGRLHGDLEAAPENLHRTLRAIAAGHPGGEAETVLVVDQFEELFTLCRSEEERTGFLSSLIFAATVGNSRCRVVLGVRADFYSHCAGRAELVEVLRDAQATLGPMSTDELHRAVVRPAARAGCRVEGRLLVHLIAQAQGHVAILPLLSHALLETWRRRRGTMLTLTGFQAVGGIEGALARTAEAFHGSLDPDGQAAARRLFLRLTALGEGTEDTKRRITRAELDGERGIEAVVEQAAAVRLVTLDGDRLEMTHEALIQSWPRLRRWLTEDRERLLLHRRLTEAADAWDLLHRDPGALYRGIRLAAARSLADSPDMGLTAKERAFLDASVAAETDETRLAARRSRRLRLLASAMAGLALLTTVTSVLAVRAHHEVERQRNHAVAVNAAAEAAELYRDKPALAVQLSLAAHRLSPTGETRDRLLSTLMTSWAGHGTELLALAVGPDGRTLATAAGDRVRLWDIGDARKPVRLATLGVPGGLVQALAIHPGGRVLATGGADRRIRLWDIGDRGRPVLLSAFGDHGGAVRALAFGPDGLTLASGSDDRTTRLWDTADPDRPGRRAVLRGPADTVRSVAFGADGRTLATASNDETVHLWDLGSPGRPAELARWRAHGTVALAVAFSPRSDVLATSGGGRSSVRLWDVSERERPRELSSLTGHSDVVGHVAFSPDGRLLASAGDDRTVRIWDVSDPARPVFRVHLTAYTTAVMGAEFTPDGRTLVSTVFDGTVRLLPTDFPRVTADACDFARPTITRAEWHRHLPGISYRPPCR